MLKSRLLLAAAGWCFCVLAWAQNDAAALESVQINKTAVPEERVFDGVIEAVNRATVSAQTSGRIVKINFDVDDFVNKNDIIVQFRDTEQRAQLEAAQANQREAQARLEQAQRNYNRIKSIYERKLVAKSAMDEATAELNAARARVKAADAQVEQAKEQLEHTVVRAPYSGIVLERHVEVGETANPGQPLMTGVSLEHLRALVQLPQSFIDNVRQDGRASLIRADGERVQAEDLVVFPYADSQSHTFKVRVGLPVGVEGLYPGMLVKIAFVVGEQQRLQVPAKSLVYRSEVTGVYVIDDNGQVSLRQVRIGRQRDGQVEVLSGLQPGERVAIDPIRAGVVLKAQYAQQNS